MINVRCLRIKLEKGSHIVERQILIWPARIIMFANIEIKYLPKKLDQFAQLYQLYSLVLMPFYMLIDYPTNVTDVLSIIDLIGTLVFAISGAMAAASKKLDLFGAAFIAFVTAVGGGTIRDLLLGDTPVGWMKDPNYIYIILCGVGVSFLFKSWVTKLRKTLFLFDTIGIAVFTILGLSKALIMEVPAIIAVMMGMFSAVLGGVIRDILINEIPLIFRKEIYAMACIAGGTLFVLLQHHIPFKWNVVLAIATIIIIRILAIKFGIGLGRIDDNTFKIFTRSK